MNARIRSTWWIVLAGVLICHPPLPISAQEADAPLSSGNSGVFVGLSAVYSFGLVATALVPSMDFGWGLSAVIEYASSSWAYEQTGYTTNQLGPFAEGGYGLYTWTATYANKERDGKLPEASSRNATRGFGVVKSKPCFLFHTGDNLAGGSWIAAATATAACAAPLVLLDPTVTNRLTSIVPRVEYIMEIVSFGRWALRGMDEATGRQGRA